MVDAFVRLVCPECGKEWQENPAALRDLRSEFTCSACDETRRLAEFMRTERDLETVEQFQ